jgi:two-component system, LytTR family, response regulator
MIRTVLIDDESSARDTLRYQLGKHLPQVNIVGEADSVESGIRCIVNHEPDLVFLDIEMPLGSGFDVLDETKHLKFQVIFITAYSQYAIQAFKFSAAAYLLKPVRISDLKEAVEKVFGPEFRTNGQRKLSVLAHNVSSAGQALPRLVLPDLTGFAVVDVPTIIRCEAERNYTRFYFTDQNPAIITRGLKEYEELLADSGFFRIHQSHLVNLAFVKRYIRGKGGEVEMSDKSVLPLSRTRKDEFLKHFQIE